MQRGSLGIAKGLVEALKGLGGLARIHVNNRPTVDKGNIPVSRDNDKDGRASALFIRGKANVAQQFHRLNARSFTRKRGFKIRARLCRYSSFEGIRFRECYS